MPDQLRNKLLLKWRTTLGWSVATTAERLGVTTRTVSSIESGVQEIPDSRWRLFLHEVLADLRNDLGGDCIVVIVGDDQSILDVVSKDSFSGYALGDDGCHGLVASHYIERGTNRPVLHRQKFPVGANRAALEAFQRWTIELAVDSTDMTLRAHQWIMRQALRGELAKPELIPIKDRIRRLQDELAETATSPVEVRRKLMDKLDAAIHELLVAISSMKHAA